MKLSVVLFLTSIFCAQMIVDAKGALIEPIRDVPQCLLSHLKEFTLSAFRRSHLQIARYIMENARVLRSMSICYCHIYPYDGDFDELFSCPRGSVKCSLHVLSDLQM